MCQVQSIDRQTWVAMGKLLNFSEPQSLLLQNGHTSPSLLGLPKGLSKTFMYNT